MNNIYALDLETYGKKYYDIHGFTKAYVVMSKKFGVDDYDFDIDLERFLKNFFDKISSNTTIYIHNGAKFDMFFILESLTNVNLNKMTKNVFDADKIKCLIDGKKTIFESKINFERQIHNKKNKY